MFMEAIGEAIILYNIPNEGVWSEFEIYTETKNVIAISSYYNRSHLLAENLSEDVVLISWQFLLIIALSF